MDQMQYVFNRNSTFGMGAETKERWWFTKLMFFWRIQL